MTKLKTIIIISLIIGFIVGLITGMIFQQLIIIKGIEKVGGNWEGIISNMNIEIDINETKLVEETWKIFPINLTWRNTKFDNITYTNYSGEKEE